MEANILVVEDEKGIRDAITIYLKNQGYYVYEAENGVQGLEMVENHTIHLAIVDIMMPVMDGITMTMKLREKYDFPLIFLSAKSEDIDKIRVKYRCRRLYHKALWLNGTARKGPFQSASV